MSDFKGHYERLAIPDLNKVRAELRDQLKLVTRQMVDEFKADDETPLKYLKQVLAEAPNEAEVEKIYGYMQGCATLMVVYQWLQANRHKPSVAISGTLWASIELMAARSKTWPNPLIDAMASEDPFLDGYFYSFQELIIEAVRAMQGRQSDFGDAPKGLRGFKTAWGLGTWNDKVPLGRKAAMSERHIAYTLHRFERSGKRIYRVSDGLAQRLLLTEMRGVKGDDIKLPFDCLYIEIPKSLGFTIQNQHTGEHAITGAYLFESCDSGGERGLSFTLMGEPNDASINAGDDAFEYFTIPMSDVGIDEDLENIKNRANAAIAKEAPGHWAAIPNPGKWDKIAKWIVAATFYATRPDAERDVVLVDPEAAALKRRHLAAPKGSPKRAELLERLKAKNALERTLLGKSVLVDRTMPTNDADAQRAFSGVGGVLTVRTLVAGHWQRFAVGKGRVDREWKFRAPFWRGPLDAPESQPTHVMV